MPATLMTAAAAPLTKLKSTAGRVRCTRDVTRLAAMVTWVGMGSINDGVQATPAAHPVLHIASSTWPLDRPDTCV